MKKQAQERSAISKLKQFTNIKRNLSKLVDKDFKKLLDKTQELDSLAREALLGKKDDSFVRQVRLAQSSFTRDNYLACGLHMANSVEKLVTCQSYLNKININLAGTFEGLVKEKFKEQGGEDDNLEEFLNRSKKANLAVKSIIIKEAGIFDWAKNLKTNIGDVAYKATNFSLWKKLFSKTTPLVKATEKIVGELQSLSTIIIDGFNELSKELASSDVQNYYSLAVKLSLKITKFVDLYKIYMDVHFQPLLNKIIPKSLEESKDLNQKNEILFLDFKNNPKNFSTLDLDLLKYISNLNEDVLNKSLNEDVCKKIIESISLIKDNSLLILKNKCLSWLESSVISDKKSSIVFSHLKYSQAAEDIYSLLNNNKIKKALDRLDFEIETQKEDKKASYILKCFKDRIKDLDK